MAINGIELEVGQEWLTRGGQRVKVVKGPIYGVWPFIVRRDAEVLYSVGWDGFAMSSDCPRDTDLVQPLLPRTTSDHAAPLPVAEPKDSNTVTSAQVNDWIEWHGGECPVGPSTPIELRFRCGSEHSCTQPGDLRWSDIGSDGDIIAYRVVKPTLFHGRERVDGEFPAMAEPLRFVEGIGDINSTAKGSGARYNTGKPALELIPLSIIVPFYNCENAVEGAQDRALRALDALGMFQARKGNVYEVLRELGDHWDGCAQVFDYGRKKYSKRGDCTCSASNAVRLSLKNSSNAHSPTCGVHRVNLKSGEWNWAKGMAWSIPIGCAARHLMAIIRGETTDSESGKPHEWHVYCNVVMLLTYDSTFAEGDDRPAAGLLL